MNNGNTPPKMNNQIVTAEILATETKEQRAARLAEFYARCSPDYARYNRGERTAKAIAAKKTVVAATKKLQAAWA